MNSVSTAPPVQRSRRAAAPLVRDGCLRLPGTFALHHGDVLIDVEIAWRIEGMPGTPVIAVLGGISADRHVVSRGDRPGWWRNLFGPECHVDLDRYRVLSVDFLGGAGQTTGPRDAAAFPSISTVDQATVLREVLDHLGLERLHAIVGASYGAMVGLAFAASHAPRLQRLVAVSGAHCAHPMATAWRSTQRKIVRLAQRAGCTAEGLQLARGLAMTTYRSRAEFAARFDGEPVQADARFRFPVEDYLDARGDAYARCTPAGAFLCLSESLDLHRLNPAAVTTPTTLVAVHNDQLVPREQMRALHRQLGGPSDLVQIESAYGHDAFLKETATIGPYLVAALEQNHD